MKKVLLSLLCVGSVFVVSSCKSGGGCIFSSCEEPVVCSKCLPSVDTSAEFVMLGTDEMQEIVTNSSAIILDARSGKYDDGQRIPGAQSLNDKSTATEIAAVVKNKDQKIVTYCANPKCPASARLAKHLAKLGYTNIVEYPLGIQGWVAAGKKTISAK